MSEERPCIFTQCVDLWDPPLSLLPSAQKRGTKALVLDQGVSGPLSLLDMSLPELMAEHGVTK